jgi:hypothetical protein
MVHQRIASLDTERGSDATDSGVHEGRMQTVRHMDHVVGKARLKYRP